MSKKQQPALFKSKPVEKKSTSKADIEGRLRKTFIDMLERHNVDEIQVGKECLENIVKAMRDANRLGYTNGFIKSSAK